MKSLPFNFRVLENAKILISNMVNTYTILPTREDLECLIRSPDSLDGPLKHDLQNKLFISAEEDFDTKIKLTASGFTKNIKKDLASPRLIMIVPTLRCDHLCSYCQVSRVNKNIEGFDLPLTAIPNIIQFITSIERPPYQIEFQGGEPLLATDFIFEFYDQFAAAVGKTNFVVIIASSLSLLDEKILRKCEGKNISFSTSIDVSKDAHNSSRILPSNDSFEKVVNGINMVQKILGDGHIGTVTTVTHDGLSSSEDLIATHLKLGLNEMFVRPVSPYGFAQKKIANDVSIKDFLIFYEALIRQVIQLNRNGTKLVEHFFFLHYKRIMNAEGGVFVDLMSPAGYAKNCILIDYTGNIFGSDEARMVHRKFSMDDLIMGNVIEHHSEIKTAHSEFLLEQSFNFDIPGCSDCVYVGSCGSDPIYHIQNFGEPIGNKAHSRFCELHKGIFDLVFKIIEDPINANVLMGWVNE